MKWFAETTNYGDAVPNGIYLLNDSKDKMFAFRPRGTGEIKVFRNPIRIDLRGRKFVINAEQFAVDVAAEVPEGRSWTVRGSKGDEYRVTEHNGNIDCTCSGFRFRGKCRHAESIRQAVG